jgi:uncharacterized protein involved in cysteine biosynthesis
MTMDGVLKALGFAFRSALHPKVIALTIWPVLAALALWGGLAWFHWSDWSRAIGDFLAGTGGGGLLAQLGLAGLLRASAPLLLVLLLAPAILITTLVLAATFAMPMIVDFVAARCYPALEKLHGGTLAGSFLNALAAGLVFAALWIATLPLLFTGVLAPVVPVLLSAFLNQRLFRYDALAEHASADEYRAIVNAERKGMYALGLALAPLYFVPFLNLLAPTLSGLAYAHLALARLAALRSNRRPA